MRFAQLAQTAEAVMEQRGTNAKRDLVAHMLRDAGDDLALAARFVAGTSFARADARALHVGGTALGRAALALLPVDDFTWRACHRAVGDAGETIQLLMETYRPGRGSAQRTLIPTESRDHLTLQEVSLILHSVSTAPPRAKPRLIEAALRRSSPVEAKYFVKLMTGGMRIGLSGTLVEDAIAQAFNRRLEDVRLATMLTGDVGETALLARDARLHEATFRMFHALGFMLATPTDDPPTDVGAYQVEDKYDGIRAQLHATPQRAELYTRTLEVAAEFPEILEAARRIGRDVVLDGEVIAVRSDGMPAPFALLQRRLGRKVVGASTRAAVPVRFVAYDLLFLDGAPTYAATLDERRAALCSLDLAGILGVSPVHLATTQEDAHRLFEAARARGNEGLMFKRRTSPYELGRRGGSWLKLKRTFATLDVVVTAAELGHGKRAGLLSDLTFAVRGTAGERLNVGKAYTGLTNDEIREMTAILKRSTIERYGSVHLVRPEIVLEVAFDGVTRSSRHKAGYALRFPRIERWRKDKRANDIDTLARVEELWIASGGTEAHI